MGSDAQQTNRRPLKSRGTAWARIATNALLRTALVFAVEPLEQRTLPELRAALADVRAVTVPAKGRPAAQAVEAAISVAIGEVETLIDKFEAGERYSFDLSDQFEAARLQVKNYAIDVDGDVREAVARLRDWGLTDLFRQVYPDDDRLYTYWDYRAGDFHQHRGMRIDLMLGTKPVSDRVSYAVIDRNARKGTQPSDHTPLIVDLT